MSSVEQLIIETTEQRVELVDAQQKIEALARVHQAFLARIARLSNDPQYAAGLLTGDEIAEYARDARMALLRAGEPVSVDDPAATEQPSESAPAR